MTNTLVGIGVGPGDPDLVTTRAADLLAEADVVFVPGSGRAERTALFYAEAWRVEQLAQHDPGHRERAWRAAAEQVARWFAGHPGGTAVVATVGDPRALSPFTGTVRDLVGDLDVQHVPGARGSLRAAPAAAGCGRRRRSLHRHR